MMVARNQNKTGLVDENKIWLDKTPEQIQQELLKVAGSPRA
jgi:hypothetical protein